MACSMRATSRRVSPSIGVDEDGALRVQRDGQPEREEAPEAPERAPVDPLGKKLPLDPERLEDGHPVGFGGQPRQAGMFEHVVEREQAPHHHSGDVTRRRRWSPAPSAL